MAKKTTYVCDRCGRIKDGHLVENFEIDNHVIHDVGWITLKGKTGYIRDVDLCDKCLKSLSKWFMEKS